MDMLVKLYELPHRDKYSEELSDAGLVVRRARSYEKRHVLAWIEENFSRGWADECGVAFARLPLSCFIGTHKGEVVAFGAYEATYKNFVGPLGVCPEFRGRRLAEVLLIKILHAMADEGSAYAILGGVDEAAPLFTRALGAMEIPESHPGIYIDRLQNSDS
jgi:GNAT superfamily N-acetyltransferase